MTTGRIIGGCDILLDGLHAMPARILAKLPPAMREAPRVRAEVGWLIIETLASSSLEALGADVQQRPLW
jgi:hypothetical protein